MPTLHTNPIDYLLGLLNSQNENLDLCVDGVCMCGCISLAPLGPWPENSASLDYRRPASADSRVTADSLLEGRSGGGGGGRVSAHAPADGEVPEAGEECVDTRTAPAESATHPAAKEWGRKTFNLKHGER
jgi:hypothetical protein